MAVGLDLAAGPFVLGGYVGRSQTDLDGANVSYDSDGWNGGLYASWSESPVLRITATVGYGAYDVEYGRTAGALRTFGETDRTQTFGSFSVETQQNLGDNWVLIPGVSVAASRSETDAYQDNANRPIAGSEVEMTLFSGGASLFYVGGAWLPYVAASFNHQSDDTLGVDGEYGVIGAGVAIPLSDRLSLAVSGQTLIGKENEGQSVLGFTLRRAF